MAYNLIQERWIPVRCVSGQRRWIAPWEMSTADDPPLRIDSGRPDFDASLLQFLIGLVQTAAAPHDNREWRKLIDSPPKVDRLREAFEKVAHAFDLDGEGPRVFQDLSLRADEGETAPIAALLIDSPGEFDHFVKRSRVTRLSRPAVAAALITLQMNAPGGGRGHRTGLRGGGPLLTLIAGDSLFATVMLNVLPNSRFRDRVPGMHDVDASAAFPWLADTRTSEKNQEVQPESEPALLHYWATPRRIRVDFDASDQACDLFAEFTSAAESIRAKSYGANYKGAYAHPLTPYSVQRDGELLPRKGRANAFQWRDWPKLTLGTDDTRPAAVVTEYYAEEARRVRARGIQISGYDMDNAKATAFHWCESGLLGAGLDERLRGALATEAQRFASAASYVLAILRAQVRKAWEGERTSTGGEIRELEENFWASTEGAFFAAVSEAVPVLSDDSELVPIRTRWLELLHREVLLVFDEYSGLLGETTDVTLRNIALARRDLQRITHPNSPKVRAECGLQPMEKKPKRGKQ